MKDRVPLYPGRVKLVPVAGQENTYDMTRADQPTQAGDPLNKATLWSDVTAALFGLGANSVPDDGFAWIGKYNQYWWKRRVNTTNPIYVEKQNSASPNVPQVTPYLCLLNPNGATSGSVTYADTVNVDLYTGEVSLVNQKQVSFDYYNDAVGESFKGKYVTGLYNATDNIYFIPTDATYNRGGWGNYFVIGYKISDVKLVTSELDQNPPIGEWVYLQSSSRDAYPDSGKQDGYEYQYLGIPFDNAANTTKIENGSYIGKGTYGSSNPNSLTLGFEPKMVCVFRAANGLLAEDSSNAWLESFVWFYGQTGTSVSITSNSSARKISFNLYNNVLSWYLSNSGDASNQLNESGRTYYYMAIG